MKLKDLMKAFRMEYIRSSYFKKVLFSFLLATCAVALLFVAALLYNSNRDYVDALQAAQEQSLTQALNVNSTNLKDIITYCNSVLDTPLAMNILYGSDLTVAQSYEALDMVNGLCRSSSLIHSACFINFRTGTVVDPNGRGLIENHMDTDIFQRLEKMTPGRFTLCCVPRVIDSHAGTRVTRGVRVVSIIFYTNVSGALVVNLDYDAYRRLFALDEGEHLKLTMVNSEGTVFLSTDPEEFGEDMTEDPAFQAAQAAESRRGVLPLEREGREYLVGYIRNEGMGITYLCSRDSLPFYSDNSQLLRLLQVSLVLLAAGLVLAVVLSWIVYDPLKRLRQTVAKVREEEERPESGSYDDFDYLTSAYQEIADMNARLREDSSAMQNSRILGRLLLETGPVSSAELESLDALYPRARCAVLVLGLDAGEEELPMEASLVRYAVQNVTQELLSGVTVVSHVPLNSDFVVFLLNFDGESPEQAVPAVKEAQAFLEEKFQTTFSAGLGDGVEELEDLGQSFASAQEAFSRRFLTGRSSFHSSGEFSASLTGSQEYPGEESRLILESIRSLSEEEAEQHVDAFFAAASTCGIEEILSFTLQLHFTVQRLEQQNYITAEGDWSYRSLERSTLSGIRERMTRRCLSDIAQLSAIREASSGRRELMDQVQELVEQNICSPELSVSWLADQVHLSVNYLRKVFKDNTGDSLSNFISQKKIQCICSLLEDTDLTLSEINDRMGFSTSNYFYAFFKKHMGMTPGDYRKKLRQTPAE